MTNISLDYRIILSADFLAANSYIKYSKDSLFEHDDAGSEPIKERSLWQAVIIRAVYDASQPPVNSQARREKTRAIIWFSMQNEDFITVCELAGVEPLHIVKKAKEVIKQSTAKHRRREHMKRTRRKSRILPPQEIPVREVKFK